MTPLPQLKWTVYKLVNPDGYVYIGLTRNKKSRFGQHLNVNAQPNRLIKNSLIEYGKDSHIVCVLEEFVSDKNYAVGKEIFWTRTYMSNSLKWPEMNGFNLNNGGLGIGVGGSVSDVVREKISKSHIGYKFSEEAKIKMSNTKKGKKNSVSHVQNVRKAKQKALLMYDLSGVFLREFECARDVYFFLYGKDGISGSIASAARGVKKTCKGYIFKYKQDV